MQSSMLFFTHSSLSTAGSFYSLKHELYFAFEGSKTISAICLKNFQEEVEPELCKGSEKPETGVFPCNKHACEPR